MADLVNEFSWSISQNKALAECKRMYYYTRYGSWEGWPTGKGSTQAKTLYILKNLTRKEMWVGSIVHDIVRSILEGLRSGYTVDYPMAEQMLIKQMKDDIQHSRGKLYRKDPKNYTGFFEDEYGLGLPDHEINDAIEFAIKCLQSFFNSTILRDLK